MIKKFVILFSILLTSCQTLVETSESYARRTSYIVYSVDLASEVQSCDISIAKRGDSVLKDIRISGKEQAFLAELEPGRYDIHILTCDGQYLDVKSKFKSFRVRKNRLNYIGNLRVSKSEDSDSVSSYKLSINGKNLDNVLDLDHLKQTKKSIRSAYNGKKIKKNMINANLEKNRFKLRLRYDGAKPVFKLKLSECRKKSSSPFILGHAEFEVEYQGFHASKFLVRSNYTTMNKRDIDCIKQAMTSIKPENNGSFSARLHIN